MAEKRAPTSSFFTPHSNTVGERIRREYHWMMNRQSPHVAGELALDDVITCLSNERRRHTIELLHAHGEPLSLSEIAERVAVRQYDVEHHALTSKQRKCVYTGLYQAHMQKLTQVDAVRFDERAKMLEPAANTAALAETITHLREQYD